MSQASFNKRQREKARKEKAAAKSARRDERRTTRDDDVKVADAPQVEQSVVLAELAALHDRFEAGSITFDDFIAAKEQLTEQLQVP